MADKDKLNALYCEEGWEILAKKAGFDPYDTESAARRAFRFAWDEIIEREAELLYLRAGYRKWETYPGQDIWRVRAALILEESVL